MQSHQVDARQEPRLLQSVHIALAIVLSFMAQYAFTGEWLTRTEDTNSWEWLPRYTFGVLSLASAMGCAALAAYQYRTESRLQLDQPVAWFSKETMWLLGGAVLIAISASSLYLQSGETILVQGLWVGSIALVFFAVWPTFHASLRSIQLSQTERLVLVGITLLGFGLRFWRLEEIPSHIDNDIPLVGVAALNAIQSQDYRWIGFSADSGHLQSYTQLYAWSMRLFGANHVGLVITSVIAGTLTLPVVYALGRVMFHQRVGLIAMVLLAGSYTHIHFSRILFGAIVTLLATLTFLLLFVGLRRCEPAWFVVAGLTTGLGLLQYESSRVVPLVALVVAAWWFFWERQTLRLHWRNLLLYLIGALIAFGPMFVFAITSFDLFLGRGNSVAIWAPEVWAHATNTYGVTSVAEVLWIQAKRTFLTFYLYGDHSPQFSMQRPIVSSLAASLMTVGLGIALLRLRDLRYFSLIIWILLTFLLGGVLTYDPPFWPHLNIVLPAVMILAGVAAHTLIEAWPSRYATWIKPGIQGVLIGLLIFTMINNWQVYASFADDNAGPRSRMSRFLSSLPSNYHVYMVSPEYTPDMYAFRFYNRDKTFSNPTEEELLANPPKPSEASVFLLHQHDHLVEKLRAIYPQAEITQHQRDDGSLQFISVRVGDAPFPRPSSANNLELLFAFLSGIGLGWMLRYQPSPPSMHKSTL
ncbi:MAG: hypothetical protein OHK0050_07060 [Roseiflexaceae bacterium]